MTEQLVPKPPTKTRALRFFAYCFKSSAIIDRFRQEHPVFFSLFCSGFIIIFVWFLVTVVPWFKIEPKWWPPNGYWTFPNTLKSLVSLFAGLILTQPIARGLVPLLIYVPHAIAMRNLGLVAVTTNKSEAARLQLHAASNHDPKEKVKVICISGRYLFREAALPGDGGPQLPLHDLARKGLLEVIMPTSDPENPTIAERYATYTQDFRDENGIPKIEDFIKHEIRSGKDFLLRHNNRLYEHTSLCMWRVVIYSDFCFIQNYFPNSHKSESFRAPVFVYAKRIDGIGPNSYFETFSSMFDLVKKRSVTAVLGKKENKRKNNRGPR